MGEIMIFFFAAKSMHFNLYTIFYCLLINGDEPEALNGVISSIFIT